MELHPPMRTGLADEKQSEEYNGQAVVSTKDVVRFTEKSRRDGEGECEDGRKERGRKTNGNNAMSEAKSRSEVAKSRNRAGERALRVDSVII